MMWLFELFKPHETILINDGYRPHGGATVRFVPYLSLQSPGVCLKPFTLTTSATYARTSITLVAASKRSVKRFGHK